MERLTKRDPFDGTIELTKEIGEPIAPYNEVMEALNKLAAYEDAEEHGRLIVLPCKVGDELWFEKNGQLRCETIDRINLDQTDEDEEPFCSIYTMSVSCLFEDIGRLVWITRKEAEEALEGMK